MSENEIKGIVQKSVFIFDKRIINIVNSSFFERLMSSFGKYDAFHIHEKSYVFFTVAKFFDKRVIEMIHWSVK